MSYWWEPCHPPAHLPTQSPGRSLASASAERPEAGRTRRLGVLPGPCTRPVQIGAQSWGGGRDEGALLLPTKYRSLTPTKYRSLICFRGTFLCCWLRAQLLIPRTVGSNEVAFFSLAHVDPPFPCWGTSWQPKTDGAALRSACTVARGRQQAHARPSDSTGDGIST